MAEDLKHIIERIHHDVLVALVGKYGHINDNGEYTQQSMFTTIISSEYEFSKTITTLKNQKNSLIAGVMAMLKSPINDVLSILCADTAINGSLVALEKKNVYDSWECRNTGRIGSI